MHKQRLAIILSALLGTAGYFLPWISMAQAGNISGTAQEGAWIMPALFGATIVIAYLGDRMVFMQLDQLIIAVGPAIAAGIIGVKKIVEIGAIAEKKLGSNIELKKMFAEYFSPGFGLYLIVSAALCVLLSALFIRKKVDYS